MEQHGLTKVISCRATTVQRGHYFSLPTPSYEGEVWFHVNAADVLESLWRFIDDCMALSSVVITVSAATHVEKVIREVTSHVPQKECAAKKKMIHSGTFFLRL